MKSNRVKSNRAWSEPSEPPVTGKGIGLILPTNASADTANYLNSLHKPRVASFPSLSYIISHFSPLVDSSIVRESLQLAEEWMQTKLQHSLDISTANCNHDSALHIDHLMGHKTAAKQHDCQAMLDPNWQQIRAWTHRQATKAEPLLR